MGFGGSLRRIYLPAGGPTIREAEGFSGGHGDEGEGLARGDEEGVVTFADHFEGAPEAGAADFFEAAADGDPVAEFCGLAVVGLGAGDDGVDLAFGHGFEIHAHEGGEAGAAGFDHAEVGEVVDHAAAIGVEEHDFLAGFDGGNG